VAVLVVEFMGWDGLVWLCWWLVVCPRERKKEKLRVRMSEEERLRQMGERKDR